MRLAILDDYQGIGLTAVDWSSLSGITAVSFGDHVHDEDALIARLSDFDAVMRIRERTPLMRTVLERLPRLKLILATGMRNANTLDLVAADELGIMVCTTDALHQTTVDITWALLLSLFRGLPREVASLRAGGWQVGLGRTVAGKTLGILGLGSMGVPVAAIAKAFGMDVIAWSPNLTPARADPFGVRCVSKAELFSLSDAITVHIPHAPSTENLVDAVALRQMKPSAFIVNTSRAEIIDQDALVEALISGAIAGLGVDVYLNEPIARDHPFRLLPNVLATPHIGFVTEENYAIFYRESLENLRAYLAGKPIRQISGTHPFLPDSAVALEQARRVAQA